MATSHLAELVGDTCPFQGESRYRVGSSVGMVAGWAKLALRAGTGAILHLTKSTQFDYALLKASL